MPLTTEFQNVINSARGLIYAISIDSSTIIYVANLYCYTGGHTNKAAQQNTNRLIKTTLNELIHLPEAPTLIVTDLNADSSDIKSLTTILDTHHWTDVGANASVWGGTDLQPTCMAYNSNAATRRDYVFANHLALPLLTQFNVHSTDDILVHHVIQFSIKRTHPPITRSYHHTSYNYAQLFEAQLEDFCAHSNIKNPTITSAAPSLRPSPT